MLILREVLRWKASEVAELLDASVASVNSTLQRARSTLAARNVTITDPAPPMDEADRALLERYVDAFQDYDMDALTALLHEEATLSMPPYELWLRGRADVRGWFLGTGKHCRGSRLVPIMANGSPAFGQYRPSGPGGGYEPWAIQVIEVSAGQIVHLHHFLDRALFARFGLPDRL